MNWNSPDLSISSGSSSQSTQTSPFTVQTEWPENVSSIGTDKTAAAREANPTILNNDRSSYDERIHELYDESSDLRPAPLSFSPRSRLVPASGRRATYSITPRTPPDHTENQLAMLNAMLEHHGGHEPVGHGSHSRRATTSAQGREGIPPWTTIAEDQEAFERRVCRGGAVLCEGYGASIEYCKSTQNAFGATETEMIPASGSARIFILRKPATYPDGIVRHTSSIWAISADTRTRLQVILDDDRPIVPYSAYFTPEKVTLKDPVELRFIPSYGAPPSERVQTSWVSYAFSCPAAARRFQSTVYGYNLVGSYQTTKTTRVHDGLVAGMLSYAEQMCGMENLRLFEDADGPALGAVHALIHFSAMYGAGYLRFWINAKEHPVRFKDDGAKVVKIRGLRIPAPEDGRRGSADARRNSAEVSAARRNSVKKVITAARIEFATEEGKAKFLADVYRVLARGLVEGVPVL